MQLHRRDKEENETVYRWMIQGEADVEDIKVLITYLDRFKSSPSAHILSLFLGFSADLYSYYFDFIGQPTKMNLSIFHTMSIAFIYILLTVFTIVDYASV